MKKIIALVVAALIIGNFAFDSTDNVRGAIVERHAVLSQI